MPFRARSFVALLAAAALLGACSHDSSASAAAGDGGLQSGDEAAAGATLSGLTVSTGILRPTFDPGVTDYDITSLNSLYPIAVTATAPDPATTLTIHGAAAQSGVPSSFTLTPREDFTIVASAPGVSSSTYTVHYVPSDYPAYTVTSAPGAGTEDVLMTPDGQYLLLLDRAGAPLYYRTFLPNDLENFQQFTLADGAVFYAATVGIFNASGWTLGVDHLMDQHFNDVADYTLLPYAQHGVLPAESHEFLLLDEQHYVAISYVQRTLDLSSYNPSWSSQAQVMSNVFQEIDNGAVLFEWDSASVPSLYTDSTYENTFGSATLSDYLHLNSIDIDPADQNFIVSFRHTNSIVKLDRHSGQILWTLGGLEDQYGLLPEQLFSFQHHVRMHPDGSMTVFDDGNQENPVETRVLSFVLDEVHHKVTSFSVLYTKPTDQPPTGLMGSAAPLSGGRLFCGWGGWYSTAIAPAATEILDGQPVWSLELTAPGVFSYRALPIASP